VGLSEGKMLRLDLRGRTNFISAGNRPPRSDTWNLTRDKLLAGDVGQNRLSGLRYGVRDLAAEVDRLTNSDSLETSV
jgi:hypothetical protein